MPWSLLVDGSAAAIVNAVALDRHTPRRGALYYLDTETQMLVWSLVISLPRRVTS